MVCLLLSALDILYLSTLIGSEYTDIVKSRDMFPLIPRLVISPEIFFSFSDINMETY
jgi:hypothetical protein